MRFFEVDSAVDAIMSAAMIAQNRASQRDKQGKLSMNGFLQMLANAGVVVDYEGFKTVFDTNPQLANVIAKFDKDSITFASADAEDEGAGYEEPQTDMPDDERVAKMAQRATKVRTRENKENLIIEATAGDHEEAAMAHDIAAKSVRQDLRAIKAHQRAAEHHYDAADHIENGNHEKANASHVKAKNAAATAKQYGNKHSANAYADTHAVMVQRATKMRTREFVEGELPPHLAKMFGKDGKQVDTRTDVMKQMRDIVDNKSAMEVEFGDGKQMIDMYTASVLTQIYDKVNDNSKEAIIQRIGTIEKFNKLMPKLFDMLGEGKSPHKKGTEKYRKHMAAMHAGESVNEAWQAFKERSLTKPEKRKMKHYEKKLPKQDFIDRYGKEQGEAIYYATATKMAKKHA